MQDHFEAGQGGETSQWGIAGFITVKSVSLIWDMSHSSYQKMNWFPLSIQVFCVYVAIVFYRGKLHNMVSNYLSLSTLSDSFAA